MNKTTNSQESKGRVRLKKLEKEGKWVFHGSGLKINILEPHQAYNYPKSSGTKGVPDDKPAVFASVFADVAIFMAVVNKLNAPYNFRSGFSVHGDNTFEFRATKETMEQIQNVKGYVYVFDKSKFKNRSTSELLSYKAVIPDEMIVVNEKDLPKNITSIN
ncbi:MAG: hypothetical protein K9L98_01805 [Candidatus Pacebacteria bacterium]|nr:hypothetical protein [Candidatus Paceibacterota bacterium]MCF7862722.1 hypothetical protein [Candidatus Paceibacterota bacterium]